MNKYFALNFRPLVIIATALMLGLFLGAYIWDAPFWILGIVVAFSFIIAFCVAKKRTSLTILFAGFIVGLSAMSIFMSVTDSKPDYYDATISCKVISIEEYNDSDYTYAYFVDDITVDDTALNKSGLIYIDTAVELYSTVTISGYALHFTPEPLSGYDALDYQDGIRYTIYTSTFVSATVPNPTKLESTLSSIKDTIIMYMGTDSGALGISILFGDRTYLSDTLESAFSTAGVSHIMCVSGLHVSFVIAMAFVFLKKFKLHNVVSLIIMMLLLYFYGVITDFPVSLIRAMIMYFILSVSTIVGMRYDMLNSIALTAIVMLIVSPITLFNVSFQLSFVAILGISLFFNTFNRWFARFNGKGSRFIYTILSSISLSLSANILVFPLIIHYFGYFGTYFILANLVIVPIVSLVFTIMWVLIALVLIAPVLTPLMIFARYFAQLIVNLSTIIASLPGASLSFQSMGALTFVYLPTVCLLSDVNCAKTTYKLRFGLGILLVSTIISLII
ncbi:MAG: ComEC/Rec2 family competence protein [Bacillota bacterium]